MKSHSYRKRHLYSGDYIYYLRDLALDNNISTSSLLEDTGLEVSFLISPPKFVGDYILDKMCCNLFEASKDPSSLAIKFGKGMNLSFHGPLGLALRGISTLKEFFILLEKYFKTRASSRHLELVEDKLLFKARAIERSAQISKYSYMALLVNIAHLLQVKLSDSIHNGTINIYLDFEEPCNFNKKTMPGVNFNFDAARNEIAIPADWLCIKLKPNKDEVIDHALQWCDEAIVNFSQRDILTEVKAMLNSTKNKNISLIEMAGKMNLSSSSLHRRLKESNTTFKHLKNETKILKATKLILNYDLSLEEISHQLGFSDVSSFTKSFKKITGKTPGQYRSSHFK